MKRMPERRETTQMPLETTWSDSVSEADASPDPAADHLGDRYVPDGALGVGGMGTVVQAYDRVLRRTVAVKIANNVTDTARSRFLQEAQTAAQLEHPGIVPVYDYGTLPDGRVFYTMKVVRGRTLAEAMLALHRASPLDSWGVSSHGDSLRRLLLAFQQVCEAMAYAHHAGVIHRDLKPANIMLGDFGEALVVDFGLAKVIGGGTTTSVETTRSGEHLLATQTGSIAGTPAFMSPEQARGQVEGLTPASDVFSLGAILYRLIAGTPAYWGSDAVELVRRLLEGPPVPPDQVTRRPIPSELVDLTMRALAPDPLDRPEHAGIVAADMRAFLEGARRRALALARLEEAEALREAWSLQLGAARRQRAQASELLQAIPANAPAERKHAGWALEDAASEADRKGRSLGQRRLILLREALELAPELPAPARLLAEHYRAAHEVAERDGDSGRAAELEALLVATDRGDFAAYLRGDGLLRLRAEPPDAIVRLSRFEIENRRMRPVRFADTSAPMERRVPHGSYLAVVSAAGHRTVRYPLMVRRHGIEADLRHHLVLPRLEEVSRGEILVHGSPFEAGDPEARGGVPWSRVQVDSFIIQRFVVTNRAYLAFLHDLCASGRQDEAMAAVPRLAASAKGPGAMLYGFSEGLFVLRSDGQGDEWRLTDPVVNVDWSCAQAYAAWLARRSNLPWRLPTELELEKAARGADRRIYPWGDFMDPSWAAVRASFSGRPRPVSVDSHPTDESPYGLRGFAGNVMEWTGSGFASGRYEVDDSGARALKGGSWAHVAASARIGARFGQDPSFRSGNIGFRLARSLP